MNPVVHFEMPYENRERLSEFYASAFGWGMEHTGPDLGDYILAITTETDENRMIKTPGTINGGFFPREAEGPQHPSVVISVDDIENSIKKIREAGGKVLSEPIEIPGIGSYVHFLDTEGNQASLLQPEQM